MLNFVLMIFLLQSSQLSFKRISFNHKDDVKTPLEVSSEFSVATRGNFHWHDRRKRWALPYIFLKGKIKPALQLVKVDYWVSHWSFFFSSSSLKELPHFSSVCFLLQNSNNDLLCGWELNSQALTWV